MLLMKKKITALVFLSLISIMVVYNLNDGFQGTTDYKIEVFKISGKFGYSIYYRGTLFIKQDHIPSVASKIQFCSEAEAKRVAELMVKRLVEKKKPSISAEDLKALQIHLNCE